MERLAKSKAFQPIEGPRRKMEQPSPTHALQPIEGPPAKRRKTGKEVAPPGYFNSRWRCDEFESEGSSDTGEESDNYVPPNTTVTTHGSQAVRRSARTPALSREGMQSLVSRNSP